MVETEPAPPEEKRSFVSERDIKADTKTTTSTPDASVKIEGKEIHILKPEVALTLIYGKLSAILDEMKTLNAVFSKAAQPQSFQKPTPAPEPQTSGQVTTSGNPIVIPKFPTEATLRVKEILAALEPVKDLIIIDTESSTMFVMVKPAQFLGPENFAQLAKIIREIGGQYVSAGKNTHFEVPKAPLKK